MDHLKRSKRQLNQGAFTSAKIHALIAIAEELRATRQLKETELRITTGYGQKGFIPR